MAAAADAAAQAEIMEEEKEDWEDFDPDEVEVRVPPSRELGAVLPSSSGSAKPEPAGREKATLVGSVEKDRGAAEEDDWLTPGSEAKAPGRGSSAKFAAAPGQLWELMGSGKKKARCIECTRPLEAADMGTRTCARCREQRRPATTATTQKGSNQEEPQVGEREPAREEDAAAPEGPGFRAAPVGVAADRQARGLIGSATKKARCVECTRPLASGATGRVCERCLPSSRKPNALRAAGS